MRSVLSVNTFIHWWLTQRRTGFTRWILLIEGLITAGFGLLCPFLIIGWPSSSKNSWLTPEEQRYLVLRQQYTVDGAKVPRHTGQSAKLIKEVAGRWHIWLQGLVYYTHTMLGTFVCGAGVVGCYTDALSFQRLLDHIHPSGQCLDLLMTVWTRANYYTFRSSFVR